MVVNRYFFMDWLDITSLIEILCIMRNCMRMFLFFLLLALPKLGNAQDEKDSAQYVVPASTAADLAMIEAPEGFIKANQFNGYYHPLSQTSMVLTIVEGATYVNIKRGLTPEYYAKQRLTFVGEKEITTVSGLNGVMITCEFDLDGKRMVRNMVFIGDLRNTLWLSVTYHKDMSALLEPELFRAYQTVHFIK